ncbi:MAG: hypothetical protein WA823_13805 [Candidatus Acidiferrales bacterium]
MRYETAFEISQMPWEWWWSLCGLPFIALGIYLVCSKRIWGRKRDVDSTQNPSRGARISFRIWAWAVLIVSVYGTAVEFWGTRPDVESRRNGSYRVAEGVADDYIVWPDSTRKGPCFMVDDQQFFASEKTVGAAYEHAVARGTPIRTGVPVRVAYEGGTDTPRRIYRLEVGTNGPLSGSRPSPR